VRPYWKGYLKLALVSCPIALHAACSTAARPVQPPVPAMIRPSCVMDSRSHERTS
jgi:hypothetical protein